MYGPKELAEVLHTGQVGMSPQYDDTWLATRYACSPDGNARLVLIEAGPSINRGGNYRVSGLSRRAATPTVIHGEMTRLPGWAARDPYHRRRCIARA
jgi:hypothetical protein